MNYVLYRKYTCVVVPLVFLLITLYSVIFRLIVCLYAVVNLETFCHILSFFEVPHLPHTIKQSWLEKSEKGSLEESHTDTLRI